MTARRTAIATPSKTIMIMPATQTMMSATAMPATIPAATHGEKLFVFDMSVRTIA